MRGIVVTIGLLCAIEGALAGDLPDAVLTPGKSDPALTSNVLCAKGFTTKSIRNVSVVTKREVYARYGMENHKGECGGKEGCEVDHLISLELGGTNDVENLWPEPYAGTKWNAHVKDRLENWLHKMVCRGQMSLREAQTTISKDWISAWMKMNDALRK